MDKNPLFQEIAESIRQDILFGNLKSGDELLTVRQMATKLNCAPGTIQRAYQELIRQGLIVSRPGQGTRVASISKSSTSSPIRKATLIHQTESHLLSLIKSGYSVYEIEQAFQVAIDRWRAVSNQTVAAVPDKLHFVGSHDMALAVLNQYLDQSIPSCSININYSGSLGGLMALAQHEADLAGCHLYDQETGEYNLPYVQRLLPGRKIGLLTLAHRRLGLIFSPGNPLNIKDLTDLCRKDIRFINRQPGAGTRVWLDVQLHQLGIKCDQIQGYEESALTHSEVASAVAAGQADLALGIQSAALAYGLGFIPLTTEWYELVIPHEIFEHPCVKIILKALNQEELKTKISAIRGYETEKSGHLRWVE